MTTSPHCPFCESAIVLIKKDSEWFFKCSMGHLFQFEGMDKDLLSVEAVENALLEWAIANERARK